ncbi:MAG TPA: hypothetical protein VK157_08285 [Phycisphaerales bacterium]|nr:hypothetical protein [Phycisphaerales bacterium]
MSNYPNVPPPIPTSMPGGPMSSMKPHRGGVVLGLGAGGLALTILGCMGNFSGAPCGLVSGASLIMSIIAWVMANNDLREMASGVMDRSGEGSTRGGKVCAIINVVLAIISLLLIILVMLGLLAIAGIAAGGGRP